jgi:MinD superfamily P-loop ATPase
MMRLPFLAMLLAGTACSQTQPTPLAPADARRAVEAAQQFAIKLGMASNCRTPGPHEHYSYKDAGTALIVDIVPPPGRGQVIRLTIRKDNFNVIRAQKIA